MLSVLDLYGYKEIDENISPFKAVSAFLSEYNEKLETCGIITNGQARQQPAQQEVDPRTL